MKLKFYFRRDCPDLIYCSGAGSCLYVLSAKEAGFDPETGKPVLDDTFQWEKTRWSKHREKWLNVNGFIKFMEL